MKSADAELITFLDANRQFFQADLYDFAMTDGFHLYLTSADVNIISGGYTYLSTGPLMQRSKLKQTRGIQVDTLTLICYATTGNLLEGTGFQTALLQGALDGAMLTMSRLIFASWSNPAQFNPVILFVGRVADLPQVDYGQIQINIKSPLELLDTQVPWQLYQSGCAYSLYDANCGVVRSSFSQGGHVIADAGNSAFSFKTNLFQTDGWFTLGKITMTSGVCIGQTRAIKAYNGEAITTMVPFIGTPAANDTFTAWAGCDRQMSTCLNKFSNQINFGGQPFIPAPSTVI
jgi:uncharacterized phage protein (TIGR02218 family)